MLPPLALVVSLPATINQEVPNSFVDQNGHMNITHYFERAARGAWKGLVELGMPEEYAATGSSFFTAAHHIRYFSELLAGDRFAVHVGLADRTEKAVHSVAFVVDCTHARVASVMESCHVHVSLRTRRATPIPGWLIGPLDNEISSTPWLSAIATGVDLRA